MIGERMNEAPLHGRSARQQQNRHQDRRSLFGEVIRLNGLGWSQLAIKRELGIDLKTIRKWLKDNQPGTWERTVFTENPADAHADYVCRRWLEGCHNATRLYREVCDRGYLRWDNRHRDRAVSVARRSSAHSSLAAPLQPCDQCPDLERKLIGLAVRPAPAIRA